MHERRANSESVFKYALPGSAPAGSQVVRILKRRGPLILTTKNGRAWKRRNFHKQWQEASKTAKIDDLHFHDLRGTAVTMLSEAGCTEPEVASITGHSLGNVSAILDKYLARTKTLAQNAIAKLEKHGTKSPR